MRTGVSIWALGLFLAVATASAAGAQDDDWRPRDRVAAGQIQPLDRILPEIRRNHPGTFYDAEGPFPGADGEMHYRLKWMTPEGRVIWFDANARTGRVMGSGGGRNFGGGLGGYDRPPNPQPYRPFDDGGPGDRFGNGGWYGNGGGGPGYGGGLGWPGGNRGGGRGGWPGGGWNGGGWRGGGGWHGGGGGGWHGGGGGHGGGRGGRGR